MDQSPQQPTHVTTIDSWPVHLATAALSGVVTTCFPMQRWSRGARWALHGGMGALSAGGVAFVLRHPSVLPDREAEGSEPPAPRAPAGPLVTAAVAALVGSVVTGVSRSGEAADSWVEGRLAARGVRRPRVWLGLAAAGASLAMSVSDRRRAAPGPSSPASSDDATPPTA